MTAILNLRSQRFKLFFIYVTLMLSTRFRVDWPGVSGEEEKNRFSSWGQWWSSWFTIGMILAILDPQVTQMLPTKFKIYWPFSSGEQAKTNFKTIFIRNDFSSIWSTSHPMLPTKFQVNILFGSGEAKNRFSRWRPWRPPWFSDRKGFM